jgi:hypothetical protein
MQKILVFIRDMNLALVLRSKRQKPEISNYSFLRQGLVRVTQLASLRIYVMARGNSFKEKPSPRKAQRSGFYGSNACAPVSRRIAEHPQNCRMVTMEDVCHVFLASATI